MGNKWIYSLHGLLNTICNTKSFADSRSRRNSEVLTRNCPQAWSSPRVIITDRGAVFRSRLVSLSSTCVTLIIVSQRRIIPKP
ncbi:hypothetical protein TNCV_1404201 [Trichonephila clavipes]|nr:hypothetical protein TNCV_1404201 [Trichonephila clavipes]